MNRSSCLVVATFLCLALAALAAGCGDNGAEPSSPTPTGTTPATTPGEQTLTSLDLPARIAVTLPVFEDFVRLAAGDHAEVFSLVPPDADPREYELSDDEIRSLEDVLFFYVNGMGLDDHLQSTIESDRDDRYYLIPFGANVRSPTQSSAYATEAGDEPHLWLDPRLAAVYVEIVADEFVIYDAVNREHYNQRFREIRDRWSDFSNELSAELEALPEGSRKMVAHSDAVTHLARRFDLDLVATAVLPDTGETEDEAVQRLIGSVQQEGVPAVFAEYGYDDSVLREVSAQTGVEVCTLYTGIAHPDLLEYEEMMRANIAEILRCLGGETSQPD